MDPGPPHIFPICSFSMSLRTEKRTTNSYRTPSRRPTWSKWPCCATVAWRVDWVDVAVRWDVQNFDRFAGVFIATLYEIRTCFNMCQIQDDLWWCGRWRYPPMDSSTSIRFISRSSSHVFVRSEREGLPGPRYGYGWQRPPVAGGNVGRLRSQPRVQELDPTDGQLEMWENLETPARFCWISWADFDSNHFGWCVVPIWVCLQLFYRFIIILSLRIDLFGGPSPIFQHISMNGHHSPAGFAD